MVATPAIASPKIAGETAENNHIVILEQPMHTVVRYGEEAVVRCLARSKQNTDDELVYQWFSKNKGEYFILWTISCYMNSF